MKRGSRDNAKVSAASLSVASNTMLIVLKTASGIAMGSISMISEAAHSGVDLVAAMIAFFSVRTSGKPADKDHPFGHGKIENLSGAVEALLIFLAAGWIVIEAVGRIMHPSPVTAVGWGVIVMLASCLVNLAVSHRLFTVGKKTESLALVADAWHLRTDVYTSAAVMFALGVIWAGRRVTPAIDLHWVDPAAALVVSVLILRAAWDLTLKSARDLLDSTLPEREMSRIRDLILKKFPDVHGFHKLKARRSGHVRFVEFHMVVNPEMSVDHSHRITDDITREIKDLFPDTVVTIHVEPCDGRCDRECEENCGLSEESRHARSQQER